MTDRQVLVIIAAARLRQSRRSDQRLAIEEMFSTTDGWSRRSLAAIDAAERSSRSWSRLVNDIIREASF